MNLLSLHNNATISEINSDFLFRWKIIFACIPILSLSQTMVFDDMIITYPWCPL